jgi:hypothetical protein
MRTLKLSTVAAVCALGTVVCFVVGAVAMASSGVGVLIPETGRPGRDWIAAVDGAGGLFFVGAWLVILMGFLGIAALVGFYDTLRSAGPVMILAPILGAVGLTLVTISHLIPIAMGYELVPAYLATDPGGQAALAATADTFAAIALVTNAAGNFLGFGVVIPLYAVAIISTRALPRWIGWLGLLVGALAGWLGLLSPASSVIASISNIGFHRLLRFHAQHGHRPAPAAPTTRRSNPAISTSTELTKGRIDPLRDSYALGARCQGSSTMSRHYRLIPVVGLVILARTRRFRVFRTT